MPDFVSQVEADSLDWPTGSMGCFEELCVSGPAAAEAPPSAFVSMQIFATESELCELESSRPVG